MIADSPRARRGMPLTLRLCASLTIAAMFVATLVGFLGADRIARDHAVQEGVEKREFALQFAERIAPLVERRDLLRLSMLATAGRDLAQARIVVLDAGGKVMLDTALVLGDRQLGLLTLGGPFQRKVEQNGDQLCETLVPVRFGGDSIGEVRLQTAYSTIAATFDFGLAGLALLCCVSLIAVAALMGHHWSQRVRSVTDSLVHLAAGQLTNLHGAPSSGELRDLDEALQELEKGVHDGLHRVIERFTALALLVVEGLERRGLVPPGHGERTARYASLLAQRIELLPADRRDLELAARLQDLGKASVRPSLLQQTEPLSPDEAETLQKHLELGAEQLDCLPGLRRVAAIVRHQNERMDGTGRPDHLRGERIPLGARVLAIASAFDLLTTCGDHRPLDCEEALAKMSEGRGEIYDAWLFDVFAEEVRQSPPDLDNDRAVMILPPCSVPTATEHGSDDREGFDYDLAQELEVMLDEMPPEERA